MVRLTLRGDSTIELRSPHVVDDSVIGFAGFVRADNNNFDSIRVAAPLALVQRLEVRRVSDVRTAAVAIGVTAGVAVVGLFVALAIACGGGCN